MTGPPRLPGYTYIQHIGHGGFADVFLYEQEWPRQRVAVKVVRGRRLTQREKSMFTIKANAMAQRPTTPTSSAVTAGTNQRGRRLAAHW